VSVTLRQIPNEQPLDFDPSEYQGTIFVRRDASPVWRRMQPRGVEDEGGVLTDVEAELIAEARAARAARAALEVEAMEKLLEAVDPRTPSWSGALGELTG
jgi:hypothetical protein